MIICVWTPQPRNSVPSDRKGNAKKVRRRPGIEKSNKSYCYSVLNGRVKEYFGAEVVLDDEFRKGCSCKVTRAAVYSKIVPELGKMELPARVKGCASQE